MKQRGKNIWSPIPVCLPNLELSLGDKQVTTQLVICDCEAGNIFTQIQYT